MAAPKLLYSSARVATVTANINATGPVWSRLNLPGATEYMVAIISTTSLVFKVQGSLDGSTNWHDLTDDITPVADQIERRSCAGFPFVRAYPVSGSGAIDFSLSVESSGAGDGGSGSGLEAQGQTNFATTVAGNATTRLFSARTPGSKGVTVHNCDGTYYLWLQKVLVGAGSATVSATSKHYQLLPGETLDIELNSAWTFDMRNSTGAATTINATGSEF